MFCVLKSLHKKHQILLLSSHILIFFITEINGFVESHSHGESFHSRFKKETNLSIHDCSPPEASPGTNYEDVRKNLIRVKCDDKYVQKIPGSPFLACIKSQWSPKQMCTPASGKPATPSTSEPKKPPTEGTNSPQLIKHDCTPPKPSEGTYYDDVRRNIIRIRCDPNYVQQTNSSLYISCINGHWSPMQICIEKKIPEAPFGNYAGCGILYLIEPLLVDGINANPAEHPWNAALYRKLKDGTMELFCGGTLITPNSILTAAHCTEGRTQPQYIKRYEVALGKTFRKYDDPEDVAKAQYLKVEKIYQAEFYQGHDSQYVFDIAIWELKTPAVINKLVIPVCIDLEIKNRLKTNMTGKIVGWGKTSKKQGSESEILQEAVVRYKTHEDCIKHLPGDLKNSLPIDKSCTTIESGSVHVVQGGDSGAGFVFEFGGRHYVYGIVSTNLATTIVSSFTNLETQPHIDFISRVLKQISQNKTSKS